MRTGGSPPLPLRPLLPALLLAGLALLGAAAAQQPRQGDYDRGQYGDGIEGEDYYDDELEEDYEENDEYEDVDEDYEDEDDDYSPLWDDEDLEEGGAAAPNATAEELELLSRVADFLVNLHQLLADLDMDKVRERADRILADAFDPVERAAGAGALAGAECSAQERLRARADLDRLQEQLEDCYLSEASELGGDDGPGHSRLDADADAAEEEAEATQLQQDAAGFLQLALAILRLTPFPESVHAAAVATDSPLGGPGLARHAEMLIRRARQRGRAATRCVDMRLEAAYRRADSAVDALAACRARAALAAEQPPEQPSAPPARGQPSDEL